MSRWHTKFCLWTRTWDNEWPAWVQNNHFCTEYHHFSVEQTLWLRLEPSPSPKTSPPSHPGSVFRMNVGYQQWDAPAECRCRHFKRASMGLSICQRVMIIKYIFQNCGFGEGLKNWDLGKNGICFNYLGKFGERLWNDWEVWELSIKQHAKGWEKTSSGFGKAGGGWEADAAPGEFWIPLYLIILVNTQRHL